MKNLTQSQVNEIFDKIFNDCARITGKVYSEHEELRMAMNDLLQSIEDSLNQSFQNLFEPF